MTDEGFWYLCVPYSAPQLVFDELLTETVEDHEIRFESTRTGIGRITIKELPSIERAQAVFAALKRGAVATSLNLGTGVRIREDLAVLRSDRDPLPQDENRPFTCRQGRDLSRIHLRVDGVRFQTDKIRNTLRQSLEVGFLHHGVEQALGDSRLALACQLYVDVHFEASDEARFLGLIGVLEVMKDRAPRSLAALALIDRWQEECGQLDPADRDSMRGALNHMRSISIGQGIRSVVERHLGLEKAREARDLYTLRSTAVHDGEWPEVLGEFVRRGDVIVRELLISLLTTERQAAEAES